MKSSDKSTPKMKKFKPKQQSGSPLDIKKEKESPSPEKKTVKRNLHSKESPPKRRKISSGMKVDPDEADIKPSGMKVDPDEADIMAQGPPDGEVEGYEESEERKTQHAKKNRTTVGQGKKPFKKAIQTASQKLKTLKGKPSSGGVGIKREHDDEQTDAAAKKPRIDEDGLTKKERKLKRRQQKSNFELSTQTKAIWEELRSEHCSADRKHKLCTELHQLVKGKCKELIFAHDTCRVLQCLMKYGSEEHRLGVFEEIRDDIVPMSKSRYAKFLVRKLLKYGNRAQKDYVFRCFHGHVRRLMRHKEGAEIVEYAYNEWAQAPQRAALVEEFYGPSFALFKTEEIRTLDQLMKSNPEKRDSILRNMKEALSAMVDKSICQYSIVHRVFLEYFTYALGPLRAEMIETVRESVVHMLHTRDGARVAMHCIWFGTAKDRKIIIKSLKTYVVKVCKEDFGHMVLLTLFDVVDDTKLVHKIIIEEMMKSVHEVAQDQYGRKVLLYLLSPRDSLHFHPDIIKVLQMGDGNPNSKKDMAVRRQELLEVASPYMLDYIVQHTKELAMNNASVLMLMTILTKAQGDVTRAMTAVAELAAEPFSVGDTESQHIVEHTAGHITLKRLIRHDVQRIQDNQTVLFSKILLDTLPEGSLQSWTACNRGCYAIVNLLDINQSEVRHQVEEELQGMEATLDKLDFPGAKLLLQKLNS